MMKTLRFRSPLHKFAAKHRLKVVTDKDDGTLVINGRSGQFTSTTSVASQ